MAAKSYGRGLVVSAAIGLLLVLPFIVLEMVNARGALRSQFSLSIFVTMWLFHFSFLGLLFPTLQQAWSAGGILATPGRFVIRTLLMLAIALMWFGLVSDQMPCFVGAPTCD